MTARTKAKAGIVRQFRWVARHWLAAPLDMRRLSSGLWPENNAAIVL